MTGPDALTGAQSVRTYIEGYRLQAPKVQVPTALCAQEMRANLNFFRGGSINCDAIKSLAHNGYDIYYRRNFNEIA